MVINVMNNLTLILLVLALCALFPTNTQATNSLSEKFSKCEKDFWFKNLSHYKKSLKSKCLKENHHKKEKRHRQHHLCNNNKSHHDKNVILSKWNKFSNCRCESALEELNTKESKVLTCYQIAKFNKVTGDFIGQLSVYKKKSDSHKYDVAVKFSDIKLLNNKKDNWSETKEGYYRSKQSTEICNDQYSIETHLIHGKISKKESMNKVSLNRISPLDIKLFDKDSKKSINLSKDQQVSIPFPNFVLNDGNEPETNPKDSKNPQDPKKSPPSADKPTSPANPSPANPSPDNQVKPPSGSSPDKQVNPNSPSDSNPYSNPSDSNPPSTPSSPTENGPQDDTNTPGNTENDANSPSTGTLNVDTASNPNTKSSNNVASSNQEATVQQSSSAYTGIILFGIIMSVGAAFVGYNTYERMKWRRHFRRGQAAAAQLNPSLANVPDYNGYGRAY